eukprot:355685-Chlamydomonas_euryale.AAC.1
MARGAWGHAAEHVHGAWRMGACCGACAWRVAHGGMLRSMCMGQQPHLAAVNVMIRVERLGGNQDQSSRNGGNKCPRALARFHV